MICYKEKNGGVFFKNVSDFNLKQTFDCGQCFRWEKMQDGSYTGVCMGRVINIKNHEDGFFIDNCSPDDFENIWIDYFDLARNYNLIKEGISKDDAIKKAINFGYGIKILKQDLWEMIISFIISQRNSIPKIKKVISLLCERYGDELLYKGEKYYTFPCPERLYNLKTDDLSFLRCGYRDKYIIDAAAKVYEGRVDLLSIRNAAYPDALSSLKQINGIGDKVALCILLFGLQKYAAFPVDTWILKAMSNHYSIEKEQIDSFARDYFGGFSGFAQQYLFYYERENGRGAVG